MIRINNLSKKFGNKIVLDNLNLKITDGEITALVGTNGAGKSTLIRIISGLYRADSGSITMEDNAKIGVLLGGDVNLYKKLTGYEIIKYFGKLHGLSDASIQKQTDNLDSILHFGKFINKPSETFSRGMKQKTALVISIIHDPDILLLDEPSTGLDIEAANDVINFMKYLKEKNKTILIATHNIFEISDLSDNIAFINHGKITKLTETKEFFKNCHQSEKSSLLTAEMKGDFTNERNCNCC